MKTSEIRKIFLDYFKNNSHTIVSSSSLIPNNDPTLLFTNAGMNQFKNVFLGTETYSYNKAATIQRCLRAGGKHNDLENVGYTARHHTFFEMLGNFSFGAYFKREAITYAWEFLTNILKIPPEKLWITVHKKDIEAEQIWLHEIKIDSTRFSKCGDKDNFWAMAETGPCGYCSEIYYDHGAEIPGLPPGDNQEGDRYVEIWNLVFMQFERDISGNLQPLKQPCVDTGMGLERIAAVLQGVHDNYEIDIFQGLQQAMCQYVPNTSKPNKGPNSTEGKIALKIISDHIRAATILVADGIIPSNEGRGYVLRKIIRRAVYFEEAYLENRKPCLHKLVAHITGENTKFPETSLHDIYPELLLKENSKKIEEIINKEETAFFTTLFRGSEIFHQKVLPNVKGTIIAGEEIFKLYDTYGFPAEVTTELAKTKGLSIDRIGFEKLMEHQREMARAASKFKQQTQKLNVSGNTEFIGYDQSSCESKILYLFTEEGLPVSQLGKEAHGVVVLEKTPFYAESGGQIGDTGEIVVDEIANFVVTDTQKQGDVYLHYGYVKFGVILSGQTGKAQINTGARQAITLNHSAAHLLHAALKSVLNNNVEQKGSSVNTEQLRFDFSYTGPLSDEQITTLENIVNQKIRSNIVVTTETSDFEEAKKRGAIALFTEKYGSKVRIVIMGDFSMELCGGTHVKSTGEIGLFKILTETAIASGIRRIVVVTGQNALNYTFKIANTLQHLAKTFKTDPLNVEEKVMHLITEQQKIAKDFSTLKDRLAIREAQVLIKQAHDIKGIKILIASVENTDINTMRNMVGYIKQNLSSVVVVLCSILDSKAQLIAGVSKNCINKLHALEIIKYITEQIDGNGGGKPELAQGGGNNIEKLDFVLKTAEEWIRKKFFVS